jgi:hypothetical protein
MEIILGSTLASDLWRLLMQFLRTKGNKPRAGCHRERLANNLDVVLFFLVSMIRIIRRQRSRQQLAVQLDAPHEPNQAAAATHNCAHAAALPDAIMCSACCAHIFSDIFVMRLQ